MNIQNIKIADLDDLLDCFSVPLRNHSRRVAVCSSIMAEYADAFYYQYNIPGGTNLSLIAHLGGTCHDVGKLLLPALVIDKANQLKHPVLGAELLEAQKETFFGNEEEADIIIDITRHHHEQPDGGGFPDKLKSKDIRLPVGICAVANTLDRLLYNGNENKSYQGTKNILKNFKTLSGSLFCESAVICLEYAWPRLMEQYEKWNNPII